MQLLVGVGLLRERVSALEGGFAQYSYSLTSEAKQIIKKNKIHPRAKFKREVDKLSEISTSELVRLSKAILS